MITPGKFTCQGVYYWLIIRRQPSSEKQRSGFELAWLVILGSASLLVRAFIFVVLLGDSRPAKSSAADLSWHGL
jgi:hypothetical protein